jgi:hypothetical protein
VLTLAFNNPAAPFTIPIATIGYADGVQFLQTLKSSPQTNISISIPGSGAISSTDRDALKVVYQRLFAANKNVDLPFNGYHTDVDITGGLLPWHMLISNSVFDPCVSRAYGIYCINGRIVWINCYGCGAVGPLPSEIGQLTSLQEIDFGIGNKLTGVVPCEIGNLVVRPLLL